MPSAEFTINLIEPPVNSFFLIREADKKESLRVSQKERESGFEDESGFANYYFIMWDKDRIVLPRWVKKFGFKFYT